MRVKLNTLLLERNIAERQQMVELAFELGANYAQTFRVSRTDDGRVKAGDQQLTREEITRAMIADQMPFRSRQVTPEARTCRVGQSSCLISPYGLVYPCIELRIPAGNLRTQRFADIWSAPIFRELAERHVMANLPDCLACPINTYCDGRCAGLAWKEHGDPYGGHTLACHQAQARYAVEHPGLAIPETPLLARQRAGAGAQPRHDPTHLPPRVMDSRVRRLTVSGPKSMLRDVCTAALVLLLSFTSQAQAAQTPGAAPLAASGHTEITLRVQTPTYTLDAIGLRVDGYGANDVPGAPALPAWGTVVELPPAGDWTLTVEPGTADRDRASGAAAGRARSRPDLAGTDRLVLRGRNASVRAGHRSP